MVERFLKCIENKEYEISNLGNIRYKNRVLKGCINHHGYKYLQVYSGGKRKIHFYHILVAKTFIGERPNGLVIDHKNRDKLNNSVDNLRYATYSENNYNKEKKNRVII